MNRSLLKKIIWKRTSFRWHRFFNESSLNRAIHLNENYNFFDLNEIILKNERHAKKLRNKSWSILNDQSTLIILSSFFRNVSVITIVERRNDIIFIIRQISFKNDFEMLNFMRSKHLKLHEIVTIFAAIFHRIIKSILHEFNWDNLIVAKNMILTTLLHIDRNKDDVFELVNFDIDIYFYELNAKKTNAKLKHIHVIWLTVVWRIRWCFDNVNFISFKNRNFFESSFRMIMKSSNVIEFIAKYFCRRFQIVLKLQQQFIDVLLKFDLNVCAMCFDEADFLMLSRCIKILKIEYNIFIMNFIWNHHLTARRESEIQRVLKYVNREFDVRILSNYVRSLKNHNVHDQNFDNDVTKSRLKKLKRIECNVKDFVHRVIAEFESRFSKANNRLLIMQHFDRLRFYNSYIRDYMRFIDFSSVISKICFSVVTLWRLSENFDEQFWSKRDRELCNFEIFVRFCAVWFLIQKSFIM